jgi:hypothetical protein
MYTGFFAAALIALILTVSSVFFLGKRGPWGSIWTFFLVLFLTLWTVSIYVAPIGPVYWGIAWVPLTIAGLIVAMLLIAAMPHATSGRDEVSETVVPDVKPQPDSYGSRVGRFFWTLIILFVIAIMVGMLNPQRAL